MSLKSDLYKFVGYKVKSAKYNMSPEQKTKFESEKEKYFMDEVYQMEKDLDKYINEINDRFSESLKKAEFTEGEWNKWEKGKIVQEVTDNIKSYISN